MLKRFRSKLNYANVMSSIAVFAALGGGAAYAAGQIDSGDIQNNQVKSGDIKNETVRSKDLAFVEIRRQEAQFGGSQASGNGNGFSKAVSVDCNTGQQLLGGGAGWKDAADDEEFRVVDSRPNDAGTGWVARGEADQDQPPSRTFEVVAICLKA